VKIYQNSVTGRALGQAVATFNTAEEAQGVIEILKGTILTFLCFANRIFVPF
jgi:hypothetical protein